MVFDGIESKYYFNGVIKTLFAEKLFLCILNINCDVEAKTRQLTIHIPHGFKLSYRCRRKLVGKAFFSKLKNAIFSVSYKNTKIIEIKYKTCVTVT